MPVLARPLALLGAVLSLPAAAGSCDSSSTGKDEDAGETGMILGGGAGGAGGRDAAGGAGGTKTAGTGGGTSVAGRAGGGGGAGGAGTSTAGKDGSRATGGTGAAVSEGDGTLGSSCTSNDDCASGLTCVTRTSELFSGKSPAGGLCTVVCQSDADCRGFAAGSYCVAFDANGTSTYCLEGCRTGLAGEPKCHERADVACTLIGVAPTGAACRTSDDCRTTELCATSEDPPVCGEIVTGCVPNCGGDFACASGDFCDFATGLCAPTRPTGRAIGALCDPNATTDACNGFCQAKDEAGTEGVCAAFCTLAPGLLGCGWDGSASADAACLYLTRLSADPSIGDVGICGALCDCNADCVATDDRCVDESNGDILTLWGRAGYCRPLEPGETEADTFEQCP